MGIMTDKDWSTVLWPAEAGRRVDLTPEPELPQSPAWDAVQRAKGDSSREARKKYLEGALEKHTRLSGRGVDGDEPIDCRL